MARVLKRKNPAMARAKILNGAELAGFVKERQRQTATRLKAEGHKPRLMILRDSHNPVIEKYVMMKMRYGADIGVAVDDCVVRSEDLASMVTRANADNSVDGVIVQLPLDATELTDEILGMILPTKDVDALGSGDFYDGATATAIHWLLAGYDVELKNERIAIVGYGRLVGRPLTRMWQNSGLNVTVFDKKERVQEILEDGAESVEIDLNRLHEFSTIVTAVGQPGLITSEMVQPGAIVVDAGVASENGMLVGDVAEAVRERQDLTAITPKVGGVGPLTVAALFENVLKRIR